MMRTVCMAIALLLLFAGQAFSAELYRYTQRNGVPCYTDDPVSAFRHLIQQYHQLGTKGERNRILKEMEDVCQMPPTEVQKLIREHDSHVAKNTRRGTREHAHTAPGAGPYYVDVRGKYPLP
jgi:hypothetical protein